MNKEQILAQAEELYAHEDIELIHDAELLVRYCLGQGILIDEEHLDTIIHFKDYILKGSRGKDYTKRKTAFMHVMQHLNQ